MNAFLSISFKEEDKLFANYGKRQLASTLRNF